MKFPPPHPPRFAAAACAALLALAGIATAAANVDDTQAKVYRAVAQLGSGDPQKRDAAAKALLALGEEARAAVFEASRSDDPELRAQASQLLLKLPWFLPDDSPAVRNVLKGYGNADVQKRKDAVNALAELTQHGFDALARLIREEPSNDVKWLVAGHVRETHRDAQLDPFRKLDPEGPDASAPLLAAAGHAWLSKDPARGARLLDRAIAADVERPSNTGGEFDAAAERLTQLALMDGRFEDALRLWRLRAARAPEFDPDPAVSRFLDEDDAAGPGTPPAVLELFATHAEYGPLPGFDKDLAAYQRYVGDPIVQLSLSRAYDRAGLKLLGAATARAAFLGDLVDFRDHLRAGAFCLRHGWLDLADARYTPLPDLTPANRDFLEASARFHLSRTAAAREDDAAAATHLRKFMEIKSRMGLRVGNKEDADLWHEVYWHELRAARQRGNTTAVDKHLAELADVTPTNPDIANDVVPILRERNRPDDAKKFFDRTYAELKKKLAPAGDNEPMPKNNLAWFLARCGEKSDEALRLATEATTAQPDNAAFVDTLAEIHFRLGNPTKAAELEERVVRARPNDLFLQTQLNRFRAAAASNDGSPPRRHGEHGEKPQEN